MSDGSSRRTLRLASALPSARGRVAVLLEGGYNLGSIANSAAATVETLLGGRLGAEEDVQLRCATAPG